MTTPEPTGQDGTPCPTASPSSSTAPPTSPGSSGTFADGLGLAVSAYRADHGAASLPGPGTFDLLVVMGSIESVTDPTVPWIAAERRLVAGAVADRVPVLGVCFGGQLLAQVLGGTRGPGGPARDRLAPGRHRRPGGGAGRPVARLARGLLHLPPGAEPVARTDVSLHAFVPGPHTGVQFHPEVTRAIVEAWIGDARERSDRRRRGRRAAGRVRRPGRGPDGPTATLVDGFLSRIHTAV